MEGKKKKKMKEEFQEGAASWFKSHAGVEQGENGNILST